MSEFFWRIKLPYGDKEYIYTVCPKCYGKINNLIKKYMNIFRVINFTSSTALLWKKICLMNSGRWFLVFATFISKMNKSIETSISFYLIINVKDQGMMLGFNMPSYLW